MFTEYEYLREWLDAFVRNMHPSSTIAPLLVAQIRTFLEKCGMDGTHSFRKSIYDFAKKMETFLSIEGCVYENDIKMVYILLNMARFASVEIRCPIPRVHHERKWNSQSIARMKHRASMFKWFLENVFVKKHIGAPYKAYNRDIQEALDRKKLDLAYHLAYERYITYEQYSYRFMYVMDQSHLPKFSSTIHPRRGTRRIFLHPEDYSSFSFSITNVEVPFIED